jgi:hypothetical protein
MELGLGGLMSATANVALANTQRAATHAVRGETVTVGSINAEFHKNLDTDMSYGAVSFGVGKAFSAIGSSFYQPSEVIGNPNISRTLRGVAPLLKVNPIQKVIGAIAQSGANAASNSTFLECTHRTCAK